MAKIVQRSRGRRLLLAVVQVTSSREVAARAGVVKSCVSEWLSGEARPCRRAAERLEQSYGIRVEAWSAPPPSRLDADLDRNHC